MKEMKDLKLMNLEKLNSLDEKVLKEELTSSSKRLFSLRMKLQVGELKQTHLIKALRRYIARLQTIRTSKGINS